MSTQKRTDPQSGESPLGPKPAWWFTLKARSFAEGVQEAECYIQNAEANAQKAGIHPLDPDRFLDVKYSSTAAQQGYVATMVSMDAFVAESPEEQLNFCRVTFTESHKAKFGTFEEAEKANRQVFRAKGMNSRHAYAKLLKLSFSDTLHDLFEAIHGILHETAHYKQEDSIETYLSGMRMLYRFKAEFTKEAHQKPNAAGLAV